MKALGTSVPCPVCWGQEECPPILWTSVKKKPTTVSVISKILKKVLIKSSYLQKIQSQTGYKLMNCGLDLTLETVALHC